MRTGWAAANIFTGFVFFYCTFRFFPFDAHYACSLDTTLGIITPILYVSTMTEFRFVKADLCLLVHEYLVWEVHAVRSGFFSIKHEMELI